MSIALREEWGGLPAITEDTKMSTIVMGLNGVAQEALLTSSFSTNSLPVSVSLRTGGSASALSPRLASDPESTSGGAAAAAAAGAMLQKGNGIHPIMRRRRFHSQELVFKTGNPVYASNLTRGMESPTMALRGWMTGNGTGLPSPSSFGDLLSPADMIRQRQRRRTLSDANAKGATSTGTESFMLSKLREEHKEPPRRVRSAHRVGSIQEDLIQEEDESNEFTHVNSDADSESEIESESDTAPSATRSRRALSGESDLSSSSSFYSNTLSRSHGEYEPEEEGMEKLQNLQKLYQEGFITVTEYKDRRLQLVDEMTMTDRTIHNTTELIETAMPVVHREPPEFALLRERDAIKHVFDSEKRLWTSARIKVKIDPHPFARGGLRQVFHLQDLSVAPQKTPDGRPMSYVAKIAIDPNENPDTYFRDVEMQAVASKFAKLYDSYNPPRRVEFLEAWIMQLIPSCEDADSDPDNMTMRGMICGVEPYIAGEYHKHNNNFGFVSDLERNTPQAFSHFTFEASGRQILVVDIQGVGDHYTDPQIHTRSGKEFGKGNLAVRGFERFLASHRCNPICRYLKLPLINPKDEADESMEGEAGIDPKGTVPAQTYMSQPRIRVKRVDTELCHYYGDSKAFKKYQAGRMQQKPPSPHSDLDSTNAFVTAASDRKNCGHMCGLSGCIVS